jgi:hypothetical protein
LLLENEEMKDAFRNLETYRYSPLNIQTRMTVYAELLRALAVRKETEAVLDCFKHYYSMVKEVCSDLSDSELVRDFTSNSEFTDLLGIVRAINKKSPG